MKKMVAIFSMAFLVMAVPVAVSARNTRPVNNNYNGFGCGAFGYELMWDDEGNFASFEEFEKNLDAAIEEGFIRAENRDYIIDMYEYCLNNNFNRANNRRGFGGGCCARR